MTLPFSALGALLAALLETSVAPELAIGGAQADLVLSLAVVAAVTMGVDDALVWAFLGGLMLDMLIPGRPIGATTLALLLTTGIALLGTRLPAPRRTLAIASVFVLTWTFHALLLGIMTMTEGVALGSFSPTVVLIAALINSLIAIPAALLLTFVERRFSPAERSDW